MFEVKNVTTKEGLKKLYEGSALTSEGFVMSDENIEFYIKWLKVNGAEPKDPLTLYLTKGKFMNDTFGFTGDNAYPDDLNIVSIELDDLENWGAIVMPRFQMGLRWLDDCINNSLYREDKGSWEDEEPELFAKND